MGTISSGVGLISGLDIESLVSQLMEIERRPVQLIEERIAEATEQQTAYTELNARVTTWKTAISALANPSTFTVKSATSSNEDILTASAASHAPAGTYTFNVQSLVSTHQLVSRGFADRDQTPVGIGDLVFKVGGGGVDRETSLQELNGNEGVRRGKITITDRSGASATVDLRTATTVNDVIGAINDASGVSVRAYVEGDALVVEDQTGSATGSLEVRDAVGSYTATDLGIAGTAADGRLVGQDVVDLTDATRFDQLNDGIGVRFKPNDKDLRFTLNDGSQIELNLGRLHLKSSSSGFDDSTHLMELNDGRGVDTGSQAGDAVIQITTRDGQSAEIDLSGLQTLQEVVDAINGATTESGTDLDITASVSGSSLFLSDGTDGNASNLIIEDLSGTAARDLGIVADVNDDSFKGNKIYSFNSIGDVVRAIEYARDTNGQLNDGRFTVSYTGNGLTFTDNTGSGAVTVEALNDSNAARDLGLLTPFSGNTLTTRDLVGGLNTVLLSSLNGGNGVETGQVQFDLRDGSSVSIDFSGDATLQQVIDRINEQGNLSAEVGPGGSGLVIRDLSTGTGVTTISDLTGQTAADLQIAGTSNDGEVFGGDLNLQYISENTLLEDLFGGQGLSLQGSDGRQVATFDIVTSNGESVAISLSSSTHQTVGDIIDEINSTFGDIEGLDVTARMNETGDGLEIIDNTGGEGRLTIADTSGSVAEKLGISGTAGTDNTLSGRLSGVIELEGSETLEDVVSTINKADVGVRASIINDGTPGAPYRLMITSQTTGSAGEIAFSSNLPGFQLSTLTEAQDASVTIGSPDSASPIIVTSSSNTINDIVDGVTLNLLGVSEGPVQVSVDSDVDSVVEDINSFVKSFNDTADRINELTDYNVETEEGGVLLGENAVLQLYNQMYSQINQTVGDTSLSFRRLSDVGISIEEGARLSFNEDEFREAFAADPDGVRKLFTYVRVDEDETGEETAVKVGIAAQMKDFVDGVTSTVDGTLTRQTQQIDQQIELYQDRISDLEDLLSRREQRLFEQFYAMERSLAELQAQQSSLSSLSSLASSAGGGVTANLASL